MCQAALLSSVVLTSQDCRRNSKRCTKILDLRVKKPASVVSKLGFAKKCNKFELAKVRSLRNG